MQTIKILIAAADLILGVLLFVLALVSCRGENANMKVPVLCMAGFCIVNTFSIMW